MRGFRGCGLAFAIVLMATGCKSSSVAPKPVAGPVVDSQPVGVAGPQVDVVVSQGGEDAVHVAAAGATLNFELLNGGSFFLSFPSDATKYPPACKNGQSGTTIKVCSGSYTCTINPVAATQRVFYKIDPANGGACPGAPTPSPAPIPFSVVHCRGC
jgi:hypothetical protein